MEGCLPNVLQGATSEGFRVSGFWVSEGGALVAPVLRARHTVFPHGFLCFLPSPGLGKLGPTLPENLDE